MTFSMASSSSGVVLRPGFIRPVVAEQHLEGLHRRLTAGEPVDGERLVVVDVDLLGELGIGIVSIFGAKPTALSWACSSSGTPSRVRRGDRRPGPARRSRRRPRMLLGLVGVVGVDVAQLLVVADVARAGTAGSSPRRRRTAPVVDELLRGRPRSAAPRRPSGSSNGFMSVLTSRVATYSDGMTCTSRPGGLRRLDLAARQDGATLYWPDWSEATTVAGVGGRVQLEARRPRSRRPSK